MEMMFCPAQNKLFTEKESSWQWWSYTASSSWPSAESGTWPNPLPMKVFPASLASCTDRPGWDITCGSWGWKSHWFRLHWKALHAPLDFIAAFVQESFRLDTRYLHTQKRILQPWITNANSPVLRHYILGWSYQLAVKDVQIWIHHTHLTIALVQQTGFWGTGQSGSLFCLWHIEFHGYSEIKQQKSWPERKRVTSCTLDTCANT